MLLRAATLLEKTGYTFTETHPPFGSYEPTALRKEIGKDEIHWWLIRREPNMEILRAKTKSTLDAVQKVKKAADGLANRQIPTSYEDLLRILREFCDSHEREINLLYEYVSWLRARDELAPTILFTYRVWGSTKRSDRWPEIDPDAPETDEWTKILSEMVLGLRDRQLCTYNRVHYGIGADLYDSMSPQEQAEGLEPIDVPYESAVRKTAWEAFAECATYFTELRDSLRNILLDIDKLSEQRLLIHSSSFWREFINASVKTEYAESRTWDFKETLPMWHSHGDAKAKAKIGFAEDVAAFANARGGVLLVGIADEPRVVIGLEPGKTLENDLQSAAAVLKAHLDYGRDLFFFEQVEVQVADVSKLYLIIVIAQACEVVGVTDGEGHFTYPVRLQTGKHRGTRTEIGSTKVHIKSDNFDFVEELLQFIRDRNPTR
jgi:hypothetical protein